VAAKLVPGGKFDEGDPAAVRFLVGRAQRFATEVNDTTWEMLKASLAEGMRDGETMDDLTQRVKDIFTQRSTSGAEMIARTEVIGAFNGGSQLAAEATGLDLEKTWITALDERVRADHADAHGQTVALDEDFEVGDATGPAPGQMGDPAQDINCRCVATYGESGRAHAPENTATSTEAQG
jgi:SPP1 gp7 family putative phage head morphogenesis protein